MKRKMSSILSKNTSGSGDLANRDVDFVVQETDSEMKIKICKVVCPTRNTHQRWKHPSRELLGKKSFDFGLSFPVVFNCKILLCRIFLIYSKILLRNIITV